MNHGDHLTRNRGPVRFVLLALGVPQALIGLWALLAPRSFYDGFPTGTDGWVSPLGPYAEHLVVDVGALFIGLGVLLTIAAIRLRRSLVAAAAVSWLIFSIPHTLWHAANLGPLATGDAIANMATLAWTVIGGSLVLLLARAPRRSRTVAGAEPAPDARGTRIEGVPDRRAGLLARGSYSYSRRMLGNVSEPTRVYAHHPTILAGYGCMEMATRRADRVPEALKHLAATKAAALSGCEWCMDIGSMLSSEAGIGEAKLRALPQHATSDELSDVEKLVLDLVVGMTATPVDVPDDLFARLREHFDDAQLVELVNEIALENYRARFNWAFGIRAQGYTAEGGYCVRPEIATA
ncbi:MAG: carboxymuconolactone decarboxylase family protein [Thermoleophilaceae bacterium]